MRMRSVGLLFLAGLLSVYGGRDAASAAAEGGSSVREPVVCGVDEIQLASDGTIDRPSLQLGERVTPNHTLHGAVDEGEYHFYHLCIVRHEHEHQININLTVLTKHGDANLYVTSDDDHHPRLGHSTWIAQQPGSDFLKLYTYLDGFPRRTDSRNRTIPLHIGVFGVSAATPVSYNLTVSVLDLPVTQDIKSREAFYTKQHERDRKMRATRTQSRRLRFES